VSAFDLDTYKLAGTLAKASGHGVAIDPENHSGLVSGNPATFFNTKQERIRRLATDVPSLWYAESTSDVDRKEILRGSAGLTRWR
jgi:hypothetical protein